MRTTLSLDDDVARLLNLEVRKSGASFKEVVNRALRAGLTSSKRPASKPFVVTARELGLPPGLSYDNVEEFLDATEGPLRK